MDLRFYRYKFPFTKRFISSGSSFLTREGIIMKLVHNGTEAFGEAAPLPGFSRESLGDIQDFLADHAGIIDEWVSGHLAIDRYSDHFPTPLPASLAFALDTALADFRAKSRNLPMHRFLFSNPRRRLAVNATISLGKRKDNLKIIGKHWNEGYRTFKLKAGGNFEEEYRLINQVRQQWPGAKIRIDANQAWTFEEAIENLSRLNAGTVEYCEEPLKNPAPEQFQKLFNRCRIPIAIDESLHQSENPADLIRQSTADILILKPMIIGGLPKLFETFRLARHHEYRIVFTTSLESGIGRMMTAVLASGLGTPDLDQGLATGNLMATDIGDDRDLLSQGHFILPQSSGIGRPVVLQHPAIEPLNLNRPA
ncbi:MAG: o-succinylbenzoate synthase [Balneolaceae bacterium]|nr:o-succinylbenzoate synthase [Balneolaceae bacterium]